jgi:TPR repeat protein
MPKRLTILTAACLAAALSLAGTARAEATPQPADAADSGPMSLDATALTGDPMAQFVAGRRYLIQAENTGRPELKGKGLAYVEAAADHGFAPAARFAGSLFLTGSVVPADVHQAVVWFEKAAALGDADSQRILADLYSDGDDLPQNLPRAATLYEAYLANPNALHEPDEYWARTHRLAMFYADGLGVTPDPARARQLWHRAATEGHYPPAQEALAGALAEGIGGPRDVRAAVKAYYDAAAAYLEGGLHFAIGPETARAEARRLLAEMERIRPGARLARVLKAKLDAAADEAS